MKKLIMFLTAVIFATSTACAKKNLFGSLPDGDHVQRVYVGEAMLKMAGYISVIGKYNNAIKSASGIEVYNIDSPTKKERDAILNELDNIIKKYVCEEVVRQQSGKESSTIYLFYGPNAKKNNEFGATGMLIVNIDETDISLVYIAGTVDFNKLIL